MIDQDKRKAIYLLHQEGMGNREISRRLGVSRNTVKEIIVQEGEVPEHNRRGQDIDTELLRSVYNDSEGYAQRTHEILTEEKNIKVTYPTLTRMLRQKEISAPAEKRCEKHPDIPGEEMQHDTTVYKKVVGGKQMKIVASLIYLRYSKRRYLKFYKAFNRFKMKCFIHEALMHWGYSARVCIIDNTNLARLSGTGANAVMVPEMENFSKQYGFQFKCHEIGHANRKAGNERCFWTTETNFFPGRTFESLEDLNSQAYEWSTVRMENRPQSRTRLIPAVAFEHERGYLTKLPLHLPAPYRIHERNVDQYGYAAFGGNFYWVPGTKRHIVKVLEYADCLKLYKDRECLAEYRLPAFGINNERFSPKGMPPPRCKPRNLRKPSQMEEKHLRAISENVSVYLDFVKKSIGIRASHGFIRKLYALSRRTIPEIFIKSIERASKFRITSIPTLERIAALIAIQGSYCPPSAEVDAAYQERDAYLTGRLTDIPDLSIYEITGDENE